MGDEMTELEFSVIIRTTGNAHEKYQRLLDSIIALEPQPKEVVVVLPDGYALPEERIGTETFLFSPKGMVNQRLAGVEYCKTPYALVCDDDVCFGPDFVQKLYEPLAKGLGGISTGPLYSFLPGRPAEVLLDSIRGAAAPTLFHKDRYVSVLKTTGYSYNRHLKQGRYYESQSVAGTCFFINVAMFRDVHIEDERWIDAHGYAALEDQIMIYKAWLRGCKTIVVPDAYYEHLDAKTSTRNKNPNIPYSRCVNRTVFWRRFIYEQQKGPARKLSARAAWEYRLLWEHLNEFRSLMRGRISKEDLAFQRKAWEDGRKYLQSAEYKDLPPVL